MRLTQKKLTLHRRAMKQLFVNYLMLAMAFVLGICHADAAEIDIKKFDGLSGKTPDQVVERVGVAPARYKQGVYEYWLFDNAVKEKDGVRTCPEVVFKNGKVTQFNFLLEATMKKSVEIANGFRDWTPPVEVQVKSFFVLGTNMVGMTKGELVEKFGQPDVKRVFNGKEVWEYQKVPLEKGSEKQLTNFVEFEDDKVSSMAGN